MRIYKFPLRGFPKPRGKVGKYGNIYHKDKKYTEWQNSLQKEMVRFNFDPVGDNVFALCFEFGLKGRGLPDVDNLAGGVMDFLVLFGYLKEDNYTVVPRILSHGLSSPENYIKITVCYSRKELSYLISKDFF